eukprot:325880-Chlamydomonas_euryale.AAC.8
MMIWSTLRTVVTASLVSLIAHHFDVYKSTMSSSARSRGAPVSMSTPVLVLPSAWAAYNADRMSVALSPEFSASVRGTTSNASAYFVMAYCSRPVCLRA